MAGPYFKVDHKAKKWLTENKEKCPLILVITVKVMCLSGSLSGKFKKCKNRMSHISSNLDKSREIKKQNLYHAWNTNFFLYL